MLALSGVGNTGRVGWPLPHTKSHTHNNNACRAAREQEQSAARSVLGGKGLPTERRAEWGERHQVVVVEGMGGDEAVGVAPDHRGRNHTPGKRTQTGRGEKERTRLAQ